MIQHRIRPSSKELISFAQKLAEASGKIIRSYFRTDIGVQTKSDLTPVTIADRRAEEVMCEMIRRKYPDHGILGEELENINSGAEYEWVLDPIDGTKTFLAGTYLFGTLLALLKNGQPILGVINHPLTYQFLVGDGETTWLNGKPVSVRSCQNIEEATLLTTSPLSIDKHRDGAAFDALTRRVKLYRTWGDCHGYFLVATGFADIMVDAAMNVWDVAALIPIIEGAGGVITDYYGEDPMSTRGTIATAGGFHDKVVQALSPDKEKK